MFVDLGDISLRSGEVVQAAVVQAPDATWAARIEAMLQHKGEPWVWQNGELLRRDVGVDARFFLLHRGGAPFANIMLVEFAGVALLAHVWTEPPDRGIGASSILLEHVLADFRARGGRAVFLSTDFDSPPWRYYLRRGFVPVETGSGHMAFYASSQNEFERQWFCAESAVVEPLDWRHWPAAAPLFLGAPGGIARLIGSSLLGRMSGEGPLLSLLHRQSQRHPTDQSPTASVLRAENSPAVLGLASRHPHPLWPDVEILDVFCHPSWWDRANDLVRSLQGRRGVRTLAYCDALQTEKRFLLEPTGFQEIARLPRWLRPSAKDAPPIDVSLLLQE